MEDGNFKAPVEPFPSDIGAWLTERGIAFDSYKRCVDSGFMPAILVYYKGMTHLVRAVWMAE